MSRSDTTLPAGPEDEPAFFAPWQARAFALTVHLHARGLFPWEAWSAALGRRLAAEQGHIRPQPSGTEEEAEAYFVAWVAALGELLAERGIAGEAEIASMAGAWQAAARATPHGQPITLDRAEG